MYTWTSWKTISSVKLCFWSQISIHRTSYLSHIMFRWRYVRWKWKWSQDLGDFTGGGTVLKLNINSPNILFTSYYVLLEVQSDGNEVRWRSTTQRSDGGLSEEEKDKRKKEGRCLRCGSLGHLISKCPYRPAARPPQAANVVTYGPELEEPGKEELLWEDAQRSAMLSWWNYRHGDSSGKRQEDTTDLQSQLTRR